MANSGKAEINCTICNKPVDLKTSKIDANGKAVHDECYFLSVAVKRATEPATRPPRLLLPSNIKPHATTPYPLQQFLRPSSIAASF